MDIILYLIILHTHLVDYIPRYGLCNRVTKAKSASSSGQYALVVLSHTLFPTIHGIYVDSSIQRFGSRFECHLLTYARIPRTQQLAEIREMMARAPDATALRHWHPDLRSTA